MSKRPMPFVASEHYHIYNRGNSKQTIFHDDADYHRFVKLLYIANSDKNMTTRDFSKFVYDIKRGNRLVSIGAYCLMPNHFHLLLLQTEKGDISKFMQKVSTAYSMYYNNKYGRSGTLFEGKFKSEHADNNNYLKYLFSYIHLNPLKLIDPQWKEKTGGHTQQLNFLKSYKFSSYLDYLGKERVDKVIIDRVDFPRYFSTPSSTQSEIFDWLSFNDANNA